MSTEIREIRTNDAIFDCPDCKLMIVIKEEDDRGFYHQEPQCEWFNKADGEEVGFTIIKMINQKNSSE